jgi:hypothetical protein
MDNNPLKKDLLMQIDTEQQSIALSILKSLMLDNQWNEYQALHKRIMRQVDEAPDYIDLCDKMRDLEERLANEIGNRQRAISQSLTMRGVANRKAGV